MSFFLWNAIKSSYICINQVESCEIQINQKHELFLMWLSERHIDESKTTWKVNPAENLSAIHQLMIRLFIIFRQSDFIDVDSPESEQKFKLWWCYDRQTLSELLPICEGNPSVWSCNVAKDAHVMPLKYLVYFCYNNNSQGHIWTSGLWVQHLREHDVEDVHGVVFSEQENKSQFGS